MRTIELIGHVDEQHQLKVEVPAEVPTGAIKVIVEIDEEDPAEWGRAVLARWAEETDDPRDDIYTLEDGVPYDATR